MAAPKPFSKVVAGGDTRASLEALRDLLAARLEGCDSGRDTASLAARLTDVLDKLAALPAPVKGTALDELARRRTADGRVTATAARSRRG